jgi:hypothetical protein
MPPRGIYGDVTLPCVKLIYHHFAVRTATAKWQRELPLLKQMPQQHLLHYINLMENKQ